MRVRFTTSNPEDMTEDILHAIAAEPNLCNHIHFPAQSGSNKTLRLMNRKYTREEYLDKVAAIRRIIPGCGLSTDIFVGYHDESDDDYRQTLDLVREVGFDSAFMFKYSERRHLTAKHLPDNVPEEVKVARLNELIRLQTEISASATKRTRARSSRFSSSASPSVAASSSWGVQSKTRPWSSPRATTTSATGLW
jgi:tRNA-2-methylthio-N6-dimethylallyladenosine synthase